MFHDDIVVRNKHIKLKRQNKDLKLLAQRFGPLISQEKRKKKDLGVFHCNNVGLPNI